MWETFAVRHCGRVARSARDARPEKARLVRDAAAGDRAGICLAGACALHCVGAPLVASFLPVAETLDSPVMEWAFLTGSLVTSVTALAAGCLRTHGQVRTMALFAFGAAWLLAPRLS